MATDSILTSVKMGVGGIIEEDTSFDSDIIMHINTVLAKLTQLGVGPRSGFSIEDKTATWTQFVGTDPRLNMVKSFVVLSVCCLTLRPLVLTRQLSRNRSISTSGDLTCRQNQSSTMKNRNRKKR